MGGQVFGWQELSSRLRLSAPCRFVCDVRPQNNARTRFGHVSALIRGARVRCRGGGACARRVVDAREVGKSGGRCESSEGQQIRTSPSVCMVLKILASAVFLCVLS